jgi:hypothetical protein
MSNVNFGIVVKKKLPWPRKAYRIFLSADIADTEVESSWPIPG